jgi:paraquat-inducible protein B
MSETSPTSALPAPEPRRDGRKRLALIWLVPLIAALAGLALVVRAWLQTGPTITITFDTAESLEDGATEVRYKDVVVGKVSSIQLRDDDSGVVVEVELTPDAKRIAVKDSRFWVVRPRIGIGGVSGINTLLSGAYIGVDVGTATESQRDFVGLEKPPAVTHDQKGRQFTLTTMDAGSVTIGAPVYYRRVAVGRIVDAALDEDGKRITVRVFIDAPYDRFVTSGVRFWNAGGVDLAVSSEGLKLNTQSLATVLAGGIAFQAIDERNPRRTRKGRQPLRAVRRHGQCAGAARRAVGAGAAGPAPVDARAGGRHAGGLQRDRHRRDPFDRTAVRRAPADLLLEGAGRAVSRTPGPGLGNAEGPASAARTSPGWRCCRC